MYLTTCKVGYSEKTVGKVYICIIMEHTNTSIVMADSIFTENPIFPGVYNSAVKTPRVLLKFGTVLSQIGSNLFFNPCSFLFPFSVAHMSARLLVQRFQRCFNVN